MAVETANPNNTAYDKQLNEWISREKAAIDLINSVGILQFDKSVDLVLFRNPLMDLSVSEILNLHQYADTMVNQPISIYETSCLAQELLKMDLPPAKIDIGKLASQWLKEKDAQPSPSGFLNDRLRDIIGKAENIEPRDVVLYGFGRIGRLAARELIRQVGAGNQLRLKAIVTRKAGAAEIQKRANLLMMDSVHGPFPGTVEVDADNKALIINGQRVQMIEASSPDTIDYTQYGINNALVIDNTGAFRDDVALGLHLKAKGASQALLTAPGKNMPNIVFGVNHQTLGDEPPALVSAASCTTNAIVPILKVVMDNFGIEKGHIETVHAYTNDQNLLDNMHKKHRRGRSAALNMVITETGAAKAALKVFPQLEGLLTANAVRVPTPDGSLAIMHLNINRETTREEVCDVFKEAALNGDLVEQIKYSSEEDLVSNDIIGSTTPAVFDSPATLVSSDGKSIVLYVWYDNEYGYTRQVIRLAKYIAKVRRAVYY